MLRFAARQAVHLVAGVAGAVVIAGAISAIAEPHGHGLVPFLQAFVLRLFHLAQLDFGRSAVSGLPALDELGRSLPHTTLMLSQGGGVALLVGVPLGLLFESGPARRAAAPLIQIVASLPVFCAGLALAYGAVHLLHWPVSVNTPLGAPVAPNELSKISVLPVLTVGLAGAGAVQLAMRRAASQLTGEAFRVGLRRLGLTTLDIERRYVFSYVMAGLATSAGEVMLALLSAAVVTEWVFNRPGAADLFVKSVALADWNMVAIILFVFAGLTLLADFFGRIAGYALANEGRP